MPLKINVPKVALFNEWTGEFIELPETNLTLEHSLVSISKWESKWHIPYLTNDSKTPEQTVDYIRCMTITQNVNPEIYNYIPDSELVKIKEYIEDPMTATTFSNRKKGTSRKIMTSEVIYFYMFSNNIPAEFDKWHLNRLLTLLEVCASENAPKKNMSDRQIMSQYASLNAARRAKLNSKG